MKPVSETEPKDLEQLCFLQEGLLVQCLEVIEACTTTHYRNPSYAPASVVRLLDDLRAHVDPDCPPPADARLLGLANSMLMEKLSIQQRIGIWQDKTFGYTRTLNGMQERLRERLVELILADSDEHRAKESAHMAIILFRISHLLGFSLMESVEQEFSNLQTQTWGTQNKHGVISHLEPGDGQ